MALNEGEDPESLMYADNSIAMKMSSLLEVVEDDK